LTRGEPLPCSEESLSYPIHDIYQNAEDGYDDTVKPRLEEARVDYEKISVIDERFDSLTMMDERVEQAIQETGAKLLILDPIQAYLGADVVCTGQMKSGWL